MQRRTASRGIFGGWGVSGVLVALGLAGMPGWVQADIRTYEPKLQKVNDRVYAATGYALANVLFVETNDSVVVIDTTESPAVAKRILEEFRKVSDKPIRYVIYTHFHGDHINGTASFMADKPHVIAQQLHKPEILRYRLLIEYNQRLNAIQFGMNLPDSDRGISLAREAQQLVRGYVLPDMSFDERLRLEEGSVKFELYHMPGETNDHTVVWLPEQKTLFCGDLFYWSFPMLASPMKPDRPVLEWAEACDRMRALEPEYLVPSHGEPITGKEKIQEILTNYAAAIRSVHDQVVRGINLGLTLEQVRATVKLPDELAKLPYLQPEYGRVDWAVNGIYRQYAGWYDMNPAHLNPGSTAKTRRAVLEAAGGVGPLVARANQALAQEEWQLVLELTDIVLAAPEDEHAPAHTLRARALEKLAERATNGVERNVYR
ncbi:MAG: alkyl/aryl-sulfatase, partial [Planctomycetaceae bacterium]|nr:alkyl/aryl-sulfatase [Planctomycetaceae bacterium]